MKRLLVVLALVLCASNANAQNTNYGFPRIAIAGGGGAGASWPQWLPFVNYTGTDIDTTNLRKISRFQTVLLTPDFADSAGSYGKYISLRAIQTVRSMNPGVVLMAVPCFGGSYQRSGAETTWTYSYYFQQWRAARNAGGGWAAGNGFVWDKCAGYTTCFHQTQSASCAAGNTTCNTNIAYKVGSAYPVCDSLVAVYTRLFINRRNVDGTYVWDGLQLDNASKPYPISVNDTADYIRCGYATHALLDTAWYAATEYMVNALRAAATAAGRPRFLIGINGGSQHGFDGANWAGAENFPNQAGGSWWTNFAYDAHGDTRSGSIAVTGGSTSYANKYRNDPPLGGLSYAVCTGDSCSAGADTTSTVCAGVRYTIGTAALTGSTAGAGASTSSFPKGGQVSGNPYQNYWYDEYAVDWLTGQATQATQYTGWLGRPIGSYGEGNWYNATPAIGTGYGVNGDVIWNAGSFEGSNSTRWSSVSNAYGATAIVSDTVHSGSAALRVRSYLGYYGYQWQVNPICNIYSLATSGDTYTATFWATTDVPHYIDVVLYCKDGAHRRDQFWPSSRQWIQRGWTPYRISCTINNTPAATPESISVGFWCADTLSTTWFDDVTLHRGKRGGMFVREFEHGLVVVNPYTSNDSLFFSAATQKLTSLAGRGRFVNDGTAYAANAAVPVASSSALFLIKPDVTAPAAIGALTAANVGATSCDISFTAPGDDGSSGTAAYIEFRYNTGGVVVSDANWASATSLGQYRIPAGGTATTVRVTGLPQNTANLKIGGRVSDDVGNQCTTATNATVTTTRARHAESRP